MPSHNYEMLSYNWDEHEHVWLGVKINITCYYEIIQNYDESSLHWEKVKKDIPSNNYEIKSKW